MAAVMAFNHKVQVGSESNYFPVNFPRTQNEAAREKSNPRSMTLSVMLTGTRGATVVARTVCISLTGARTGRVKRGGGGRGHTAGELRWEGFIQDLGKRGWYLPAPHLGINFFLGQDTSYGRKSLVDLAA